ncbi:PhaM family polyhydroxyalkanoate granule multifunctional regulatory protein [Methylibium sp.]|uniref:PhaM family polyhydroxyalkanoate granule multifunctional regulatory protein n=1 Tax=Methylibium sp. TaxID=2067992 RepID=UPI0017C95640|nr:PhaM family polyhydroxyalkanoate granule multifunctional regulatory protein [Methylibium sp.]MBA3589863.1 hypothetical protein [Methylibium sp.]
MADAAPDFAKLVPGFDFLQGLVKNASSVLPNIGQWVAPTLDPEELEKRIEELRTVQFWLEQNARMLSATIQALEVQRMTLSTLKTMNVQVADLRESMRIKLPDEDQAGAGTFASAAQNWPMPGAGAAQAGASNGEDGAQASPTRPGKNQDAGKSKAGAAPAGVVDPMQWWGALTKQFTELAANAMKDAASDSAQQFAGNLVKQGFDTAGQTAEAGMVPARKVAEGAGNVAGNVSRPAAKVKAKVERKTSPTAKKAPARKAPVKRASARRG